ncbi:MULTISPECIES: hypothetical protein [Streptomyces]
MAGLGDRVEYFELHGAAELVDDALRGAAERLDRSQLVPRPSGAS